MLNRTEIERYLNELNALMAQDGLEGELIICGGAVMSLVYLAREATKDIDALFEPAEQIRKYSAQIAENHDLESDWINDAAKGFIDTSKMSFEPVFELSNLKIHRPTDEEMLALKLSSAREESYDFSDALYLMKRIGIEDMDEVYDIMQRYIPANRLTPLAGLFAEQVFAEYQSAGKATIGRTPHGIEPPAPKTQAQQRTTLSDDMHNMTQRANSARCHMRSQNKDAGFHRR